MHPIEHLRYVARSSGAPAELLMAESARALSSFADDPVGLVTACRRIVSRQLPVGGVWWVASRMLCSPDPRREVRAILDDLDEDRTSRHLALALGPDDTVAVLGWSTLVADALVKRGSGEVLVIDADREGPALVRSYEQQDVEADDVALAGLGAAVAASDVVVIDALAASPAGVLATSGSLAAAAVAKSCGVPVWLSCGVGRALPRNVWSALIARWDDADERWEADEDLVPIELIDDVAGPNGRIGVDALGSLIDCPIAPELFKADIT